MKKFDYEKEKYEVTCNIGDTARRRTQFFDTIDEAIEYAKSVKEKEPIIYERRKVIIDL